MKSKELNIEELNFKELDTKDAPRGYIPVLDDDATCNACALLPMGSKQCVAAHCAVDAQIKNADGDLPKRAAKPRLDPNEAPPGYIAVAAVGCRGCTFDGICNDWRCGCTLPCTPSDRKDKCHVIFVKDTAKPKKRYWYAEGALSGAYIWDPTDHIIAMASSTANAEVIVNALNAFYINPGWILSKETKTKKKGH
jgi:hypothetical protein